MANKIFLLNDNQQLIGMDESPYDSEELLQVLLAEYPELLSSDDIGVEPRKWLLISRETPVPDMDEASGRWSLDHLFLDQDGIPTLVEVKRSTDTRIRREVVGQMLDYAANAIVYWKIDEIRTRFETRCEQQELDPDRELQTVLGIDDVSDFWERVRINLKAGKIRMLFVADEIPYELTRIIEFLNVQMSPAEVLGIEIKQFVNNTMKTLVPKLIGQTTDAQSTKGTSRQSKQWDEASFFQKLNEDNPESVAIAIKIYNWCQQHIGEFYWGKGSRRGSCIPIITLSDKTWYSIIALWTSGDIEFLFEYMRNRPLTEQLEFRDDLRRRFNAIEGIQLPEKSVDLRPSIPITVLSNPEKLEQFLGILKWYVDYIQQHS